MRLQHKQQPGFNQHQRSWVNRNVYDFFMDEVQEPLITIVMKHTNQNQSETARILGISRGTLRMLLKKFGMLSV